MHSRILSVLCLLGASASSYGQGITFQQREDLSYQRQLEDLAEKNAKLDQSLQDARADIGKLQTSLKAVREQAKSAVDRSKVNGDEIGEIKWVGRGILGAVAFLVGVILTQWITKLMSTRRGFGARRTDEAL